jgi:hypothetical protein
MNASRNSTPATATRRRTRRLIQAAAATAGLAALIMTSAGSASAAVTPTSWFMTAGNIQQLNTLDPASAAHFFNTPAAFGAGASLVSTPVQRGYATTPVLSYSSYAQFSSDIAAGAITYPYTWVMYDPENWSATPVAEQQNPVQTMNQFAQLAHQHGLKVIQAPALDLCSVPGTVLTRLAGESCNTWYTRVNIAGSVAPAADVVLVQDESNTTSISQFDSLYTTAAAQAKTADNTIKVYGEVSTANGTATQMVTAAKSVTADGWYVAAPSAIPQADQFFQTLQTAGY